MKKITTHKKKLPVQGEIDARADSFAQTAETGQKLLDDGIEQADEIRQCLQQLATEQASLKNLWEERRILYEQCMDLQLFYRSVFNNTDFLAIFKIIDGFVVKQFIKYNLSKIKKIHKINILCYEFKFKKKRGI